MTSLLDCVESDDPKIASDLVEQQFMFNFATIKVRLDNSHDVSMLIPLLEALLKQNMSIDIGHCISMGFDKSNNVRMDFIASVAAVFKVPETRVLGIESAETQDLNLADILVGGSLDLVEQVVQHILHSSNEAYARASLETAYLKDREYDYIARVIDVEFAPIYELSKTTIFRGKAFPTLVVGHWLHLNAMECLRNTLKSVFEYIVQKVNEEVHFTVDQSRLEAGEDINENVQNFREILSVTVPAIFNGCHTIPDPVVYVAQMTIYNSLISYFFLRFIIYAFAVPAMTGLQAMMQDKPKAVFLQLSTVIMSSILKGKLDDKAQFLLPFNDIAKAIQDQSRNMFDYLVNKEVSHECR